MLLRKWVPEIMTQVTFTSKFSEHYVDVDASPTIDYGNNFIGGKGCLRVRCRIIFELTFGATVRFVGVCFLEGATHVRVQGLS